MQTALEKLKQHPEPEAGFMLMRQNTLPAYNVQTAVDTEHALIVAQAVVLDATDSRCLQPMAEAAKRALGVDSFQIVADAVVALCLKRRRRRFAVHNSETLYKKTVLNDEIEYCPQVLGAEAY